MTATVSGVTACPGCVVNAKLLSLVVDGTWVRGFAACTSSLDLYPWGSGTFGVYSVTPPGGCLVPQGGPVVLAYRISVDFTASTRVVTKFRIRTSAPSNNHDVFLWQGTSADAGGGGGGVTLPNQLACAPPNPWGSGGTAHVELT